jgi:hypothetical protein
LQLYSKTVRTSLFAGYGKCKGETWDLDGMTYWIQLKSKTEESTLEVVWLHHKKKLRSSKENKWMS